jgi:ABC-type transport system involved in cytochrome c biogenesis permease subunit
MANFSRHHEMKTAKRRIPWLGLALVAAVAAPGAAPAPAPAPAVGGPGSAYETLARLVVMHEGRRKPLDTVAREEVKLVYSREAVKLFDPQGKVRASWGPVAALFGWSVNPEFWDEQDIVLVEYLPLKQMLLADAAHARLAAIASKPGTPAEVKPTLQALGAAATVSAEQVRELARHPGLPEEDRTALDLLAFELGEGHKWLSPRALQDAQVTVEGKKVPFQRWYNDIAARTERTGPMVTRNMALSTVEKKAKEVGDRLLHYQMIRGDTDVQFLSAVDQYIPRPSNAAYIQYCGAVYTKITEAFGRGDNAALDALNPVEQDAANVISRYFKDLQADDRRPPGTDAAFDAALAVWLRDGADWASVKLILEADLQELIKAGYPSDKLEAFRASYRALKEAETARPGGVTREQAAAVVAAARDLGTSVNAYPSPSLVDTETHFNAFAPFYKAPMAYFAGMVLLLLSLAIAIFFRTEQATAVGTLGRAIYGVGMAAFLGGIALEVYGFALRVRISGWAPVTNMYETVIWVALVAAVLGLVFELLNRKIYPALAATGVAFLATTLAATVPSLLDPNIKSLQPVLRSNYWLTIHVLTEVSSYAAFALAMGLGLIAVGFYLTATYRRAVGYGELALPLLAGLPLLVGGGLGVYASRMDLGPVWLASLPGYIATASVAGLGGFLTITALGGMLGETVSRARFRQDEALDEAAVAGYASTPAAATTARSQGAGGVATLAKPTVAEIRERTERNPLKLTARERAMQVTAGRIKPLSNFIYRVMQVGVLLVASGTILGGVWADYSWGRFWGWDPKEVWALITLLVYLVPLHGRFAGWINTFGLVVASVVCFLSVMMAWYGVNFVLGVGLHSYGFVEGGSQGVVLASCAAVLAVVAAAAWRRGLAHRPSPAA